MSAAIKRLISDTPVAKADDVFQASDVWLVPRNGRVVVDERGNSVWQWPQSDDPFAQNDRLQEMNPDDLRVVEPVEIRRSRLPWVHESERPAKEVVTALSGAQRTRLR